MKKLLVIFFATLTVSPLPVFAEFIYSGMRQGITYSIYVHEKQYLGNNRWRFRTRAEYSKGKDFYSLWRVADCEKSMIDGKIIPAIARYGYQEGSSEVIRTICRKDD